MDSLRQIIENIENDHQMVKVFGAIIYSDAHPYIKKVLRDEDYWKALNKISGNRWAIFSARATQGRKEIKGGPPGTMGMMVQVWVEPEENKKLTQALGISTIEKPIFVIFVFLKNGEILKSTLDLEESSLDQAYKRINGVVKNLTESIEQIDHNNIHDYESVFYAVDMEVQRIKNIDLLKNIFSVYKWIQKIKP